MKRRKGRLSRRYGHAAKVTKMKRYRGADLRAERWAVNPEQWSCDIWIDNSLGRRYLAQTTAGTTATQALDRAERVVDAMKGD